MHYSKEIDIISKLSHPFIVHCFGGFEVNIYHLIILSYFQCLISIQRVLHWCLTMLLVESYIIE